MPTIGVGALVAWQPRSDLFTATSPSTIAASMPLVNAFRMQPTEVVRFLSSSATIVLNLPYYAAWLRGVYVDFSSLAGGMSLRVRGADTEADLTADPAFDSGSDLLGLLRPSLTSYPTSGFAGLPKYGALKVLEEKDWIYDARIRTWWRLDFDFSSFIDGYVDIGRILPIFDDHFLQPTLNFSYPYDGGYTEAVTREETPGGQVYPSKTRGRRTRTVRFGYMTHTEAETSCENLIESCGYSTEVLFSPYPTDAARFMRTRRYGLISSIAGPSISVFDNQSVEFTIEDLK